MAKHTIELESFKRLDIETVLASSSDITTSTLKQLVLCTQITARGALRTVFVVKVNGKIKDRKYALDSAITAYNLF